MAKQRHRRGNSSGQSVVIDGEGRTASREADMLRCVGLKITPQRVGILSIIHHASEPLALKDIASVAGGMPSLERMSLATIYKNLHMLESVGLVFRDRAGGYAPYDLKGLEQVAAHSRIQIAKMLRDKGYSAEVFVREMQSVEAEVAAALQRTATDIMARHGGGAV